MSSVTSHPLYAKTTSNLERTAVRDKIMRLVQYFSRFLSYYLYRKGYPGARVAQFKALTKNLSLARKVMRVGKPLNQFKAFVAELANKTNEPIIHFTTLGKNAAMGTYLILDTMNWLNSTGVKKFENWSTLGPLANRLWLIALVNAFIQSAYVYYRADAKEKALSQEKVKDQSAVLKAQAEKKKAATLLVWNGCDIVIPATSLGYFSFDEGFVGLAGTVSSFLGLRSVW